MADHNSLTEEFARERPPSSTQHSVDTPGKWEMACVAIAGMAFTAWWAMDQGKGISWDQKNYHHYNVYAWLSGRMDYHVAPAGQHTWLNPLAYVPQYWLINHLPPVATGVIFGAWVGLNIALIYALARLALTNCSRWLAMGLALVCVAAGFADPNFLGMTGTSDVDHLVSLPVLASLCALCWATRPERSAREIVWCYAFAGLMLGAAAGLKWTCFVYAAGMTATLLLLWRVLRMDGRRFGAFAVGGVLGFLPAGGYWSWLLWSRYGNPVLPYWNDVFRSPWMPQSDFRDMRFPPQSAWDGFTYAFQFFIGGEMHPTSEGPLRDARFAILSVLLPLVLAVAVGQTVASFWGHSGQAAKQPTRLVRRECLWLLVTFSVISYTLWLELFSIHRYLAPLTFLTGLLLLLCADFLIAPKKARLAVLLFLASFSVYWMRVDLAGWRVPYGSSWFGVQLAPEAEVPNTLFVMLGGGPMGHQVPYLPESARVVRLIGSTVPEDGTETEVARRAAQVIAQHPGPMRSLSMEPLQETDFNYLRRFGLVMDETSCVQFSSDVDRFTTCPIARAALPAPAAEGLPQ